MLTLSDRKDAFHTAQLNVSYQDIDHPVEKTTVWAISAVAGIETLRDCGLMVPGDGVNPVAWIPPHRILRVDLMGTVDPAQARAAADKYNEECPRC
jgi:hypothetical protein